MEDQGSVAGRSTTRPQTGTAWWIKKFQPRWFKQLGDGLQGDGRLCGDTTRSGNWLRYITQWGLPR